MNEESLWDCLETTLYLDKNKRNKREQTPGKRGALHFRIFSIRK